MTVQTGSCLCGAVTYEAEGEPRRVFECYCNWCQRITGGSARAYAVFDTGKVKNIDGIQFSAARLCNVGPEYRTD